MRGHIGVPGSTSTISGLLPQAEASEECIGVIAGAAARRELFQFLGIAAADNHIVELQGRLKTSHAQRDEFAPSPFAEASDRPYTQVVLEGSLAHGEVGQFHRNQSAVYD